MAAARAPVTAVAIGCSAGGLEALRRLLAPLPADFAPAIVVVAHLSPDGGSLLPSLLASHCRLPVVEAEDKMAVRPGRVHIAPPGYHLLVEADQTLALSVDDKVCNVRPSVDVLFESAADAWGAGLVGVVLTGANSDGARGLRAIKAAGGRGLAQDPGEALADTMPLAAIATGAVDQVLGLGAMAAALVALAAPPPKARARR